MLWCRGHNAMQRCLSSVHWDVPSLQKWVETSFTPALGCARVQRTVRIDGVLTQLFYARKFENGEMQDVTVLDYSRAATTQMLLAEKGVWNEAQARLGLLQGSDSHA